MKAQTLTRLAVPIIAALLMIGAGPAPATQPPPQTEAVAGKPVTATVTAVQGLVQYRGGDDKPWQNSTVGQVVGIGGEFRTGPHSSVSFKVPPDQTVTLDRLGSVKLLLALQNNAHQVTTDLGMKYGRVHYDVQAGDQVDHQATIRSPSATLAIRGTHSVTLFDQLPGPAVATGDHTYLSFHSTGSPVFIHFGSKSNNSTETVSGGYTGPAGYRNYNHPIDSGDFFSHTGIETQILSEYGLYNGIDFTTFGVPGFHGQSTVNTQIPVFVPAPVPAPVVSSGCGSGCGSDCGRGYGCDSGCDRGYGCDDSCSRPEYRSRGR